MYNNKNRQNYLPKPTTPHPLDLRKLVLRAQYLEEAFSSERTKNETLSESIQQLSKFKRTVSRTNTLLKEKLLTLSGTNADQAKEIQQLKVQNEDLTRQLRESSANLTLSKAVCATLRAQQQQYTSADQMSAESFPFSEEESLLVNSSPQASLQASSLFQNLPVNNESSLQEDHSGSNDSSSEDVQRNPTGMGNSSNISFILSDDHFLHPAAGEPYTNF